MDAALVVAAVAVSTIVPILLRTHRHDLDNAQKLHDRALAVEHARIEALLNRLEARSLAEYHAAQDEVPERQAEESEEGYWVHSPDGLGASVFVPKGDLD